MLEATEALYCFASRYKTGLFAGIVEEIHCLIVDLNSSDPEDRPMCLAEEAEDFLVMECTNWHSDQVLLEHEIFESLALEAQRQDDLPNRLENGLCHRRRANLMHFCLDSDFLL